MCSIAGFNGSDRDRIQRMNAEMKHRGPDGEGVFVTDDISLGHTLLSITETPELSAQPFFSADKRHVLVYNGEIYNYRALREELQSHGYVFTTDADTEVLLAGLAHEGSLFIPKLNGMFAFAWYDIDRNMVTLARDRMGMKPLYYFIQDGRFVFSSELRGLLSHRDVGRQLDHDAAAIFFEIGYIPGAKTLIQDVQKLIPGQYLEFDLSSREYRTHLYSIETPKNTSFSVETFRSLLGNSVIQHTMGLRPFGMYLSGGIDSSIVLYELLHHGVSKPITYTTRFAVTDVRFNEDAELAKRLSRDLGADHHEVEITERDFIDAIEPTIAAVEEPRYHPSIPAYFVMAREAHKQSVVILTGDGGDELFLGYEKYRESLAFSHRYKRAPRFVVDAYYRWKKQRAGRVDRSTRFSLHNPVDRWWYLNRIISEVEKQQIGITASSKKTLDYLKSIPHDYVMRGDMENAIAAFDRRFWLAEDSLIISDKIGMHFGMESRFPFLDRSVVSFAENISSQEKDIAHRTKALIRRAYGGVLPSYILEKRKSGWTAPVGVWMQSQLGDVVRDVLSSSYYSEMGSLFNFDDIRDRYASHGVQTSVNIKRFFPLFMFQIWARHFKIKA